MTLLQGVRGDRRPCQGPSVSGQDLSETKKISLGLAHCGLGLAGLAGVVL